MKNLVFRLQNQIFQLAMSNNSKNQVFQNDKPSFSNDWTLRVEKLGFSIIDKPNFSNYLTLRFEKLGFSIEKPRFSRLPIIQKLGLSFWKTWFFELLYIARWKNLVFRSKKQVFNAQCPFIRKTWFIILKNLFFFFFQIVGHCALIKLVFQLKQSLLRQNLDFHLKNLDFQSINLIFRQKLVFFFE